MSNRKLPRPPCVIINFDSLKKTTNEEIVRLNNFEVPYSKVAG